MFAGEPCDLRAGVLAATVGVQDHLIGQLAALPVTVVLLVVLLPRWSLVGAGVSSLAAYLTAGIVCVMGIRAESGLSIRAMLIPTAADLSMLKVTLRQMWQRRRG